jgi:hypothetical protein
MAMTGRYRRWPTWKWFLASFLLSCFSVVTFIQAYDLLSFRPVIAAVTILAIPVSYLLGTWLSVFIASKLARTGIGFHAIDENGAASGYVSPAESGDAPDGDAAGARGES